MSLSDYYSYEQLFAERDRPRTVPLGWDWVVTRFELFFTPKPKASQMLEQAKGVLALEPQLAGLSDEDFYAGLDESRSLLRLGRETESDLLLAMARVREVSRRVRGQNPYLPQVAGALGLLQNCIVEMATGEGKTLTAGLAAVIAGWRGRGCHVVTSNDYLAARDAESMADLFTACGLTSASVTQENTPEERKKAYASDITYLTSKEVTADFLRDQMALGKVNNHFRMLSRSISGMELPSAVQRGLACAIVDEADSVLCDGGSTPLIISVTAENAPSVEQYQTASEIADNLAIGVDYRVNIRYREARLTDLGKKKVMESLHGSKGARVSGQGAGQAAGKSPSGAVVKGGSGWAKPNRAMELVLQAIEAREFFQASVHYVVTGDKVVIVDEATGRIMPDHEWRDGLHQAVSAKEGLEVIPPRSTSAQSTFQDFFLRYKILGGMTGTAWEAKGEFLQFYRLSVARIPTHRPCQRHCSYRAFHTTNEEKIKDIVESTRQMNALGRPVLVGTRSIEASEDISKALHEAGIKHEVLNAVLHEREAEIVALAGKKGAVTVATNMAGRGTDIKLDPEVKELGGLHVILTEMHSSERIDRQLYGRCGRQGDPGTTADIICLEDVLFETIPGFVRRLLRFLLKTTTVRKPALAVAWKLAGLCQWLGDRRGFKMRRNMVDSNRRFADMISYSGKQT